MHIEIEVALNFIISYLYNKLPRRRVNIFGEELEKALKHKFQGHWYPEKPVKGSAFRCFKTGDTPDPVLEIAAIQSGVPSADILENLPHELSVWIDPGEVSYRVGEKGIIKILYSSANAPISVPVHDDYCPSAVALAQEVSRTFNPEAQCFKPMDTLGVKFGNLSLLTAADKFSKGQMGSGSESGEDRNSNSDNSEDNYSDNSRTNGSANEVYLMEGGNQTNSGGATTFLQRSQPPSTFTIASFAATKFGSTKLKTSSKRNNRQFSSRMSPVEFTNYLKQRSQLPQHSQYMQSPNTTGMMGSGQNLQPLVSPSRSLSPAAANQANSLSTNNDPFYFHNNTGGGFYHQQQPQPFIGSHPQQLGFITNPGGSAHMTPSPPTDPISSSVSSINSGSSSSASSSVSSSSLGDNLLQFSNPFGNAPGQMYNFYGSNDATFIDNSFYGSLSSTQPGNLLEDSVPATTLLEGNPKFGVIGGGFSAIVTGERNRGPTEQSMDNVTLISNDNNNNKASDPPVPESSPNPSTPLENVSANSNNFYNGSSKPAFPQLLVAN